MELCYNEGVARSYRYLTSGTAASSGSRKAGATFHRGGTRSYRREGAPHVRPIHPTSKLGERTPLRVRAYPRRRVLSAEGEVRLGGLTLCNRHADLLRLEERTTYWRAMLAHLELSMVRGGAREAEGGPGGPARDRVDEGLGGARARFRRTGEARTRTSRGRR